MKRFLIPALLFMFVMNDAMAQPCGGLYPNPKGTRVANINVGLNQFYDGLIQYLPTDYATQPTKKYPVIIYFHGFSAQGTGTTADLCKIITDQQSPLNDDPSHLIDRIERGTWGADIVPTVNGTSFIVIAPQMRSYGAPYNYAEQTDDLIDYVLATYRVDPSRVYLTGMSTGANQAMDYISSSVEHAQRIAAASFGALCFPRNLSSSAQGAANIAAGDVATWFVHCADETASNPNTNPVCVLNTATDWVNAINAQSPTTAPRFTILTSLTPHPGSLPYPQRLNWCRGDRHNAWNSLYSPDFVPTSAPGPSMFSWFLTFQQEAALPVVLKSFTARLSNGKVYLRWVTTSEQENEGFVIERAGANGSFGDLVKIGGSGNSNSEKTYEYVDENPLANLSFYRLKQEDASGRNRYFDTRKVMNRGTRFKSLVMVTPNPFTADPSAFVTVEKKQRVSIWLTDMSGRILSQVNNTFEEGQTELSLPTTSLPRGVYFIKVKGESITETHKIIKQ